MFAKEKLTATQIKNILMQKYQEIHLIDKKLDNIIQSTKKISKDDAADLYKKLNEYKNKNPLWFVEASVDVYTRRLNKLFWINPTQKINWRKYNDVVIIDSTYKTNAYNLILCIVLGINNEGRSIILCQALLDHENVDSFDWFFNCMKNGYCLPQAKHFLRIVHSVAFSFDDRNCIQIFA